MNEIFLPSSGQHEYQIAYYQVGRKVDIMETISPSKKHDVLEKVCWSPRMNGMIIDLVWLSSYLLYTKLVSDVIFWKVEMLWEAHILWLKSNSASLPMIRIGCHCTNFCELNVEALMLIGEFPLKMFPPYGIHVVIFNIIVSSHLWGQRIRQGWTGTLVHVWCEKQIKVMCPLCENEQGMGT